LTEFSNRRVIEQLLYQSRSAKAVAGGQQGARISLKTEQIVWGAQQEIRATEMDLGNVLSQICKSLHFMVWACAHLP
jgi:hypothetical protein